MPASIAIWDSGILSLKTRWRLGALYNHHRRGVVVPKGFHPFGHVTAHTALVVVPVRDERPKWPPFYLYVKLARAQPSLSFGRLGAGRSVLLKSLIEF